MGVGYQIRPGRPDDAPGVLAINVESAPHVGRLTPGELAELTTYPGCFLVAEAEDGIAGYLLAFAPGAGYSGEEFLRLSSDFPSSLYIDQVAVAGGWRRRGVGAALYAAALAEARRLCLRHLTCEVNLRPANRESLRFHRALGFRRCGRMEVADGRIVSLQARETYPSLHSPGSA